MVWELDRHTHTQTHKQTEFYNIRFPAWLVMTSQWWSHVWFIPVISRLSKISEVTSRINYQRSRTAKSRTSNFRISNLQKKIRCFGQFLTKDLNFSSSFPQCGREFQKSLSVLYSFLILSLLKNTCYRIFANVNYAYTQKKTKVLNESL